MREIKFRAWDEYNKQMIIWEEGLMQSPAHSLQHKNGGLWKIMQFTGLNDKNGKEIYEGDIVRVNKIKKVVEWEEENAEYKPILSGYVFSIVENWEVIGNIYENPELLEQ